MKFEEALRLTDNILLESSVARTKSYLENYMCATISAFRPQNKRRTNALNRQKSSELGKALSEFGYTHFIVDGAWVKKDEDDNPILDKNGNQTFGNEITYFVVNNNGDDVETFKKNLTNLGKKFLQDSVMFYPKGAKLAYWKGTTTRKKADLKLGENQLLKNQNKEWNPQQYRTTLKGRKNTGYSYELTNTKKQGNSYD